MRRLGKIAAVIIAILVMAFVVFRTPDTDVQEMRAKYGDAPSQFVELDNGMTVHLRDEGPRDGQAIILLHGSNADLHTWDEWANELSRDFRVIRFDQRGHGLTGPAPDGTYLLENFTGDLEMVARALDIEKFVLAGNSMGGWVSAGYAIEHPERLDGLVLVDASGSPIENDRPLPIGFRIARTPILRDIAKYFMPRSIFEKSLEQSVSNQAVVTGAEIDRYWELARYPGNREATMQRFRTPRHQYSAQEMVNIRTPALLIWGEEDNLVPLAAGEWYAKALPNAQMVSYPAIGHIPQQEISSQSVADLRSWITGLGLADQTPQ